MPDTRRPRAAHRSAPWAYPALLARYVVVQLRLRALEPQLAQLAERCGMYELWYRSGLEIQAGLQADLAGLDEQLRVVERDKARLEKLAEQAAPTVSGWKVDLEAALADNEVLRARLAELESATVPAEGASGGPIVPSPPEVRAATFQRLAAAAPATMPTVVPLQQRDQQQRDAS
jgi:hypothetical protein